MTSDDPGRGDVGYFSSTASSMRTLAAQYSDASTAYAQYGTDVAAHWSGDASVKAAASIAELPAEFAALQKWTEADASAIASYGSSLDEIKTAQLSLEAQRTTIEDQLDTARYRLRTVENEMANLGSAVPAATQSLEQRATSLRQEITYLGQSQGWVGRQWNDLVQQRTDLDNGFVATLEGNVPPGLLPKEGFATPLLFPQSTGMLAEKTSEQILAELGTMTQAELEMWIADNPDLVQKLTDSPPSTTVVANWWLSLNPGTEPGAINDTQRRLLESLPAVFGNMDGISFTGRDIANRLVLQDWLTQCYADAVLQGNVDAAEALLKALKAGADDPVHQLISFTPGDPPLAAISVGNLDTAMYVDYMVSGMGTTVEGSANGWTNQAEYLYDEQTMLMNRYGMTGGVATVAWMGYEAPPVPDPSNGLDLGVLSNDLASTGGDALASDLQGLLDLREATGNDPHLAVTGHSYGSTTAAYAVTQVPVDSFTMIGSAGIDTSIQVDDMLVPDGQVYASLAHEKQPWATIGQTFSGREDPRILDGVSTFDAVDSTDGSTDLHGTTVHDTSAHSSTNPDYGYLDQGTTTLHDVALTGLGLGGIVDTYQYEIPPYQPGVY